MILDCVQGGFAQNSCGFVDRLTTDPGNRSTNYTNLTTQNPETDFFPWSVGVWHFKSAVLAGTIGTGGGGARSGYYNCRNECTLPAQTRL